MRGRSGGFGVGPLGIGGFLVAARAELGDRHEPVHAARHRRCRAVAVGRHLGRGADVAGRRAAGRFRRRRHQGRAGHVGRKARARATSARRSRCSATPCNSGVRLRAVGDRSVLLPGGSEGLSGSRLLQRARRSGSARRATSPRRTSSPTSSVITCRTCSGLSERASARSADGRQQRVGRAGAAGRLLRRRLGPRRVAARARSRRRQGRARSRRRRGSAARGRGDRRRPAAEDVHRPGDAGSLHARLVGAACRVVQARDGIGRPALVRRIGRRRRSRSSDREAAARRSTARTRAVACRCRRMFWRRPDLRVPHLPLRPFAPARSHLVACTTAGPGISRTGRRDTPLRHPRSVAQRRARSGNASRNQPPARARPAASRHDRRAGSLLNRRLESVQHRAPVAPRVELQVVGLQPDLSGERHDADRRRRCHAYSRRQRRLDAAAPAAAASASSERLESAASHAARGRRRARSAAVGARRGVRIEARHERVGGDEMRRASPRRRAASGGCTWFAVKRSCWLEREVRVGEDEVRADDAAPAQQLRQQQHRDRDGPDAAAARDDEQIEIAVGLEIQVGDAARQRDQPRERQRADQRAAAACWCEERAGCAPRAGAARRPGRRGRSEKRIRRGSRRCAAAARCRRRRRESPTASARTRSACGAAARASADSRTATRRSRCARWPAPVEVIPTSSPTPIATSSAAAPLILHRHGPQRDDASGRQEQLGAERRPRGALDRPQRESAARSCTTLTTSASAQSRGVRALAVPADQLMRQREVQRHQRKRQQQDAERRHRAARTARRRRTAPASRPRPEHRRRRDRGRGDRHRDAQRAAAGRRRDTATAAPRPAPPPGTAAALRPAGTPRCRARPPRCPTTAAPGTRRCGNRAPTARCPRRSARRRAGSVVQGG